MRIFILPLLLLVASCASSPREPVEATSLGGEPLYRAPLSDEATEALEQKLAEARAALRENPTDEMAWIWVGRRLAYLGRHTDAIAVYTQGIRRFPESYRLLRHRGHRYITTRQLEKAVDDLSRAASLAEGVEDQPEPDGMPNRLNIPRSTTQSNIYYHLGLAQYLLAEYESALATYDTCLSFAEVNDDMLCATLYWRWLTLSKLGRTDEAEAMLARVTPDMDVIENQAYLHLLLLFKGRLTPEEILESAESFGAATGYGIGAWHEANGRSAEATRMFKRVMRETPWAGFGHIAAEAELARKG